MNTAPNFEQLIVEGIKGLSQQCLSEVADFVLFLRRRVVEQQPYDVDSIRQELSLRTLANGNTLTMSLQTFISNTPKNELVRHRYNGHRVVSE